MHRLRRATKRTEGLNGEELNSGDNERGDVGNVEDDGFFIPDEEEDVELRHNVGKDGTTATNLDPGQSLESVLSLDDDLNLNEEEIATPTSLIPQLDISLFKSGVPESTDKPALAEFIDNHDDIRQQELNDSERMPPPSRRSSTTSETNASEDVPHKRSSQPLDTFSFAFGLWCIDAGISRMKYTALLEGSNLLENLQSIQSLKHK
ncbi:MAG: hypothetical protein M1835_007592 [Candelina submexicana]|nr:MAG: hypothetical protein M1835_007592 [Candelina submexicana]